jgi:RNA-directed DNA polymerase
VEDAPVNTGATAAGYEPGTGVPRMQAKLHRWAVAEPGRRFDDVFNLVHHRRTLIAAFDRVASNAGAKHSWF